MLLSEDRHGLTELVLRLLLVTSCLLLELPL
jgi:hypothetical protein